jgi:hypothetical protein
VCSGLLLSLTRENTFVVEMLECRRGGKQSGAAAAVGESGRLGWWREGGLCVQRVVARGDPYIELRVLSSNTLSISGVCRGHKASCRIRSTSTGDAASGSRLQENGESSWWRAGEVVNCSSKVSAEAAVARRAFKAAGSKGRRRREVELGKVGGGRSTGDEVTAPARQGLCLALRHTVIGPRAGSSIPGMPGHDRGSRLCKKARVRSSDVRSAARFH